MPEDQEVAQTEEQELESVMAGYNGESRAEEAPDPEEPQQEEVTETPSLEDELKALKEKVHGMAESSDPQVVRKMYGEIGNINRALQQLQSAPPAEAAPAEKAAALVLKRLSNDFPEVAEPLAEDIAEAIQSAMQGISNPVDIDAKVTAEVTRLRQQDAIEALMEEHPDAVAVKDSDAFNKWLTTLPAEKQQKINSSWNPAVVSRALSEFKSTQSSQTSDRERKQKRLESAVVTQGTTQQSRASTIPDEEGLNIGYYGKNRQNKR